MEGLGSQMHGREREEADEGRGRLDAAVGEAEEERTSASVAEVAEAASWAEGAADTAAVGMTRESWDGPPLLPPSLPSAEGGRAAAVTAAFSCCHGASSFASAEPEGGAAAAVADKVADANGAISLSREQHNTARRGEPGSAAANDSSAPRSLSGGVD
jgi:hypothetical protein